MTSFHELMRGTSKNALPFVLVAGAFLSNCPAQAQQTYDNCVSAACERDVDADNLAASASRARINALAEQWYKTHPEDRPKAPMQQQIAIDPYIAKAQAIFALDVNGNYKDPRVGQIIRDIVKLYNQAGTEYEHTPGLYAPIKAYFNRLKPGQEQNIALIVIDDLTPVSLSGHNVFPVGANSLKTIVGDYAAHDKEVHADGFSTIAERYKGDVLKKPETRLTDVEAERTAIASVIGVQYPVKSKFASASPAGQ